MRNPIEKFRQSSIVFENPGFCLKNLKLWQAPSNIEFNIFCWNFAHVSYLPMSTKGCSEFFFILFRSWVICKNKKRPGFYTFAFFLFLLISQDFSKIKNPEHPFVDIVQ